MGAFELRDLLQNPAPKIKNAVSSPRFKYAALCFAFFTGIAFYYEIVFQLLSRTIGAGIFRAMLFCLIGAAILALIIMTLPRRAALIVSEAALFCASAVYISQFLYSRIFQEFYSVDKIATASEAITHFGGILVATILGNVPAIILLLLPVAVVGLLYGLLNGLRRAPHQARLPLRYALAPIAVLMTARFLILAPVAADPYSARAVRYGQGESNLIASMREVGLFPTMELNLLSGFIKTETSSVLKPYTPPPVVYTPPSPSGSKTPGSGAGSGAGTDAGSDTGSGAGSDAELGAGSGAGSGAGGWPGSGASSQGGASNLSPGGPDNVAPTPPPVPPWVGKVNGFDIDFETLIERDARESGLVQLHQYFASLEASSQNEKTGICEGYNLITISAEAFTPYFIDPELTPTLYMMQQEGIYLDNFYGLAGGGTIGGEVSLITGLLPRGGEVWCKNAAGKHLPFTFASQFKALGIQPIAYHNGSYTYYNRHTLLPDLGYDFRARGHGLDFQGPGWHMTDRMMVELSIDQYIDDDRFCVHYMTVSGHSPYSFEDNVNSSRNRDAVRDLPYSPQVRAYIACQLELEYMLKYLLERLDEKGIADRTLIAMTTDHYPYGLAVRDIAELAGHSLDAAFGLHRNAGFIYARGLTPEFVEAPAFVPDIVPTVLNLLGLPFDSRFMAGRDVFSDALPLVYLDGGYMTNAGTYDRSRGKFASFEGYEVPDEYAPAVSSIVDMKRSAEERILRWDYFAVIADYLSPPGKDRITAAPPLD